MTRSKGIQASQEEIARLSRKYKLPYIDTAGTRPGGKNSLYYTKQQIQTAFRDDTAGLIANAQGFTINASGQPKILYLKDKLGDLTELHAKARARRAKARSRRTNGELVRILAEKKYRQTPQYFYEAVENGCRRLCSLDVLKEHYEDGGQYQRPPLPLDTCINILELLSENGLPFCGKCGDLHIELTQYQLTREEIDAAFLCIGRDEEHDENCNHDQLVWKEATLAKVYLADDLARAKLLLADRIRIRQLYLSMNRRQIPICQKCHSEDVLLCCEPDTMQVVSSYTDNDCYYMNRSGHRGIAVAMAVNVTDEISDGIIPTASNWKVIGPYCSVSHAGVCYTERSLEHWDYMASCNLLDQFRDVEVMGRLMREVDRCGVDFGVLDASDTDLNEGLSGHAHHCCSCKSDVQIMWKPFEEDYTQLIELTDT